MTALHRFAVLVDTAPTVEQARVLMDLPDRPLVERRLRHGHGRIVFERPGTPDLLHAALGALRDVASVGLEPVRLVHGDWVTLGDIAERVGRSREAVRLWSLGRTGPGGFPPPQNVGADTLFYSWVEVATWLRERLDLDVARPDAGLAVADAVVRMRQLRRLASRQ